MTELNENQNRQDSALAQLLVHAPLNNDESENDGAKVSLEELALLAEGKLDEGRRKEVVGQLSSDQVLYESWLTLQELLQTEDGTVESTQAESVNASLNNKATRQNKVIKENKVLKENKVSIIEQVQNWFNDLFSWQSAFATSFGLVLGVVFVTQLGYESHDDFESDVGNGIALHAPIQTPQKANMDQVNSIELATLASGVKVSDAEIISIKGNTVHFKLTLSTGEILNQTYVYKPNNK